MAGRQTDVDAVEIEVLTELDQFRQTLAVQQEVWGFADVDKVPARLFTVATHIGGLALGAYLDGRMIGFSLGMPGCNASTGELYLHSHMTGILAEAQGLGLGRRLKLRQRDEALQLGYKKIQWTFDPLEIRNAYFNIEKLGVIVRAYHENVYGITSSKLHAGLPTDRLVAEWFLEGRPENYGTADQEILVPGDVRATTERSAQVQAAVRSRFLDLLAQGLIATSFRRLEDGGGAYGLVKR